MWAGLLARISFSPHETFSPRDSQGAVSLTVISSRRDSRSEQKRPAESYGAESAYLAERRGTTWISSSKWPEIASLPRPSSYLLHGPGSVSAPFASRRRACFLFSSLALVVRKQVHRTAGDLLVSDTSWSDYSTNPASVAGLRSIRLLVSLVASGMQYRFTTLGAPWIQVAATPSLPARMNIAQR